ncbi:hypothetical protein WMY93_018296 [Mugilogobius chulae]|uniref:Uncharacterized protein n=1 Tax=Mugilogobius chulae TaxID=88201 RepID=A0AAW0NNB4_9GOBI
MCKNVDINHPGAELFHLGLIALTSEKFDAPPRSEEKETEDLCISAEQVKEEGDRETGKACQVREWAGRAHFGLGLRHTETDSGSDTPLPGQYPIRDFLEESELNPCRGRTGSKDLQISPCHYEVAAKPVEKIPCKHVMFRSSVQRVTFPPKTGPAPCAYSPEIRPGKSITSSFKSTLPRLHHVHPKTPGPGAYEPFWKLGDCVNTNMDPSFSFFFRNLP